MILLNANLSYLLKQTEKKKMKKKTGYLLGPLKCIELTQLWSRRWPDSLGLLISLTIREDRDRIAVDGLVVE